MKRQIYVENVGNITLTDKNYIGSGGEASVYKNGKYAIKLYHDLSKSIPKEKMLELGKIQAINVLKPLYVVYDSNDKVVIGYAMNYVKDTEVMCKLFTKSFKQQNNISPQMIAELVKRIQETVAQVHYDNCLIVDLNEMNLLVSKDFKIPYFIDTDSYQTPNYRATAIMDSVRDRTVPFGTFSNMTDWYAFGIIAFQLYIGIHPYKGKHPKYKPNEWQKRMDAGVSVFEKDVKLPLVCNDFSVIPQRHRIWFEDIFLNNNRSEPPQIDVSTPITIAPKLIIINSTDTINVNLIVDIGSKYYGIRRVYDFMGIKYFVTRNAVYKNKNVIVRGYQGYDKILLCETSAMSPITCKLLHQTAMFEDNGNQIGQIKTHDFMYKHGKIYTMWGGNLYRNSFRVVGGRILHQVELISQVSEYSSTMYDGVIHQNLLGKNYFTIPLDNECKNYYILEVDGYRIIDVKLERNICIVIGEKKGEYYRFVIIFDYKSNTYTVRRTDDISYDTINFTVLVKGICILLIENGQAEIFRDNIKVKVVDNVPFDSSMELVSFGDNVYFIHEDKLFSITMKII